MVNKFRLCAALLVLWAVWSAAACAESTYDTLCKQNNVHTEDVTAWIEISGASFSQPVMQHEQDDSFYSEHDASGKSSSVGALYTQASYNAADFSDPVTIVYGSSQTMGAPFRDLQEMYSGSFDAYRDILLHLPEETVSYRVFAAVPYQSIHILHYYDFSQERRFNAFFDDVFSTRLLGMHLDMENRPGADDSVLILSTGLRGDRMQRYLVMAKRIQN